LFAYLGNDDWATRKESGLEMTGYEAIVKFAFDCETQNTDNLSDVEIERRVRKYLAAMRTKLSHVRNAIKYSERKQLVPMKLLYRGWQRHSNKLNIIITLAYTENEARRAASQIMKGLFDDIGEVK
jgi:CRISPR/Cas system type I-B associated protein Csh2 (Cas7 group RAMP superfamily)